MSDRVFRDLLDAVLTGAFAPGEKLPGQRALARDLGVTLSPLREALQRLEQMGLVEVRHGDAMRVRPWREAGGLDVLAHVLFRAGGLDRGVLAAILEARALMLRELAGLAAARCRPEHGERLRELAAAFAAAGDDGRAAAFIDFAFMTEVARAADNVVFDLILNAIRDLYLHDVEAIPVTADPAGLAPRYAALADAIADGDGDRARDVAGALVAEQTARVAAAAGPEGDA
ncbi:MAG TPA: GntR family transcriptional regulator [Baekduia sp.]|nr:GntR family transcriptional regulator [Baekduia sp.]